MPKYSRLSILFNNDVAPLARGNVMPHAIVLCVNSSLKHASHLTPHPLDQLDIRRLALTLFCVIIDTLYKASSKFSVRVSQLIHILFSTDSSLHEVPDWASLLPLGTGEEPTSTRCG